MSAIDNIRERGRNMKVGFFKKLASQPRAFWGMHLAHLGVAMFVVGVALVKGYPAERDVRMMPGEQCLFPVTHSPSTAQKKCAARTTRPPAVTSS